MEIDKGNKSLKYRQLGEGMRNRLSKFSNLIFDPILKFLNQYDEFIGLVDTYYDYYEVHNEVEISYFFNNTSYSDVLFNISLHFKVKWKKYNRFKSLNLYIMINNNIIPSFHNEFLWFRTKEDLVDFLQDSSLISNENWKKLSDGFKDLFYKVNNGN